MSLTLQRYSKPDVTNTWKGFTASSSRMRLGHSLPLAPCANSRSSAGYLVFSGYAERAISIGTKIGMSVTV